MIGRRRRIVAGITGPSGPIYGIRTLQILREHADIEVRLVMTEAACRTISLETDWALEKSA